MAPSDPQNPGALPPREHPAREHKAQFDAENRLKPEFVREVRDALADDNSARAYDLVEPLHPADIADLLELLEPA